MIDWLLDFTPSDIIALVASIVAGVIGVVGLRDRLTAKAIALNNATIKNLETRLATIINRLAESESCYERTKREYKLEKELAQ